MGLRTTLLEPQPESSNNGSVIRVELELALNPTVGDSTPPAVNLTSMVNLLAGPTVVRKPRIAMYVFTSEPRACNSQLCTFAETD